jgi:uncharacterized protein (TIGR04255 family)
MATKMKNAPVYLTVAQVRFNTVLNMEGYLSTIQERMRSTRFPDFKRESIHQLILPFTSAPTENQLPAPSFIPQARCRFGNIEGTTEFILENNAIALQTTAYDTHETFFKILLDGLTIVHEAMRLDFTERIGLRYFDAVLPKSGEKLSDYLTPEVLGLSTKLTDQLVHSYSETVTNTSGKLVSRIIIQHGRVGLPPDVAPYAPKLNERFIGPEGIHATLDTDAFYDQREAFDLEKVGSKLIELHSEIRKSFTATITPFAHKAWE